ncbi:MAG: AAA family ATPase [Deltaproteobacteria bacterium]|nr:AAA family ATPase [Deltaproteobacteria bacterium]
MRCSACQHENREEAKFCEACGNTLELACPSCGNRARVGAAFCDTCGASLKAKAKGKNQSLTPNPQPPLGERRQLTVMFCDLVGSTALSSRMDPEEWRTVVQDYQHVCGEVIRRFDGHVAQYLGDGLLVYFGYPAAHEDDVQRAVRAGLEIIAALQRRVPSPLGGEGQGEGEKNNAVHTPHPDLPPQGGKGPRRLQVRIGIHTGLVVIGEIGDGEKREQLALGATPNLAARLQGVAEPDTVVVSAVTYRLIEGLFDSQDLGSLALKGIVMPTQVYRITGEGERRSRLEVAAMRGLTPLVGREEETALLFNRWEHAKAGEGQVVLLSGEAGIGKSRLTQVLKDHIAQAPHARIEWRCSPYHQNSALYPVIEQLQHLLQFGRDDSSEEKFRKLENILKRRGEVTSPLQEVEPLLAALLSLPLPDHYPPLNLTPQRQKQKTLEALLAWLLHEAQHQPVLVVVEDLHWVDPSTLELLSLLIDQVPSAQVLVVLTFRPNFTPPWSMTAHLTQLMLSRLDRKQVAMMVEKVASGKTLPPEIIQQIVEKTDGVPLFVEELTKAVLESGDVGARRAVPLQTIPATLHDSLMARLDHLSSAKEIAQLGATLGREFSYELIHAVSPRGEKDLQQALAKLVESELLYRRDQPLTAPYTFKHALVQDTAYQSLLKSTRQQMHQRIAQVLEEQFSETKEAQPELLAHHCTEAGLIAQAIPYWQRAGEKAAERLANIEAISHVRKGLALLQTLPATAEHIEQELTLQMLLNVALMVTKGFGAPEAVEVQVRMQTLCQQVGETPQVFRALPQLRGMYFARGEIDTARTLAEQYLALAQRLQFPILLVWASYGIGETLLFSGEVASARVHLEQGIAAYDPEQVRAFFVRTAQDPGVACLSHAAAALWYLGFPDQAFERIRQAHTLAYSLAHPFSVAWTLCYLASHHQLRRDEHLVQEQAEAAIQLAQEQGFPFWIARAETFRGWALAQQGQGVEGIAQIRRGMDAYRAQGVELYRPQSLALIAEAYGQVGQGEEGLKVLAEALEVIHKTEVRLFEAEVHRLKGELTLQQEGCRLQAAGYREKTEEAEECFRKAIAVAQKQQAKSLELRAVMSLARLWQQQGKQAEARNMLVEIYGWFTEGFDTKDLQEAKALLEELSH